MSFVRRLLFTKSFAALVFAGFTCAYMVAGPIAGWILKYHFTPSMPFIFIIEGLVLAIVVAVLRDHLFDGPNVTKMRLPVRVFFMALGLAVALGACLLLFFPFHTDWAKLWLIVAFVVLAVLVALFILAELADKPKLASPDDVNVKP